MIPDILMGYAGLTVAFVILSILLLFIFIRSNVNMWVKIVMTAFVAFYSVCLYFVPGNFMGWPTERMEDVGAAIVLSYKIHEPEGPNDQGAIYFWVLDFDLKNIRGMLNPKTEFMPYVEGAPRSFVIIYDSELHKRLIERMNELRSQPGTGLKMNMEKLKGMSDFGDRQNIFEIFDPRDILNKSEEEGQE